MNPEQREKIKAKLRDNILLYKPGHYYPIPDALLRLVLHWGISLSLAKELFAECALENEEKVHLSRGSFQVVFSANIQGERGRNRIVKWYPKVRGFHRTYFIAQKGGRRMKEGKQNEANLS